MKTKPPTNDDLLDALMGEDELGVVLRAHFYVEGMLDSLINELIPFPKHLPRLRFEQKVKLACAIGLNENVFNPLKKLGDLRNSFSHHTGAQLSEGVVKQFFDSFVKSDQETILKGYSRTLGQTDGVQNFKELFPKDRFILSIIALYKILEMSHMHVKDKPLK